MVYCRLKWEMETGLGARGQSSHMSALKQGRAEGARPPQRHYECAQGRERSGAATLSEKLEGPGKRSRRKEQQRRQNKLLSVYHMGPRGSPMIKGSQMTVLS